MIKATRKRNVFFAQRLHLVTRDFGTGSKELLRDERGQERRKYDDGDEFRVLRLVDQMVR